MILKSAHNPKFKLWSSLLEAKGIQRSGLALVCGRKIVDEVLATQADRVECVLVSESDANTGANAGPGAGCDAPKFVLARALFKSLDIFGTKAPLAVVRTNNVADWPPTTARPRELELIIALSDPANLGAVLRSCEAFGVGRVILTKECASPFLPKAIRASSGSCLRLELYRTGSALADLAVQDGVTYLGLDADGADIREFRFPENAYLILGEEGQGLPSHLPIQRLAIPMEKSVESLNATVAASIALFLGKGARLRS